MHRRIAAAAAIAVLVAALTGLVTVGVVASPSMAPALPEGTVFVAWPGHPDVGDVVVYRAPDGARVVHRVVAATDAGLVTRGDANAQTDQAVGIPPVDPSAARVVPSAAGAPLVVKTPWLRPVGVVALQIGLLAWGLRGALRQHAAVRSRGRGLARPHVLVAAAAAVVLFAAPMAHDEVDATGAVAVNAGILPTVIHVASDAGEHTLVLPPMADAVVQANGVAQIVRAPALPGAASLIAHGAAAAAVPTAATLGAVAAALRRGGW